MQGERVNTVFLALIFVALLVAIGVGVATFDRQGAQLDANEDSIQLNQEVICAIGQIVPAPQGEHESDPAYLRRIGSYALARALLRGIDCKVVLKAAFRRDERVDASTSVLLPGAMVEVLESPPPLIRPPDRPPGGGGGGGGTDGDGDGGETDPDEPAPILDLRPALEGATETACSINANGIKVCQ